MLDVLVRYAHFLGMLGLMAVGGAASVVGTTV